MGVGEIMRYFYNSPPYPAALRTPHPADVRTYAAHVAALSANELRDCAATIIKTNELKDSIIMTMDQFVWHSGVCGTQVLMALRCWWHSVVGGTQI